MAEKAKYIAEVPFGGKSHAEARRDVVRLSGDVRVDGVKRDRKIVVDFRPGVLVEREDGTAELRRAKGRGFRVSGRYDALENVPPPSMPRR